MSKRTINGFTLIELITTIVIVGSVMISLISILSSLIVSSVRPIHYKKSYAMMSSYMEEIIAKPFQDPETLLICDPSDAGEGSNRTDLDDICDYDGLFQTPHDFLGNAIADYEGHTIAIDITPGSSLDGLSSTSVIMKITVTGHFHAEEIGVITRYVTNS